MPGAVATESHAVLGVAALAGNTKGKRPKTRRKGGSVCDRSRVTSYRRNFVSTCVEILLVGLDADIGIGRLQIEKHYFFSSALGFYKSLPHTEATPLAEDPVSC